MSFSVEDNGGGRDSGKMDDSPSSFYRNSHYSTHSMLSWGNMASVLAIASSRDCRDWDFLCEISQYWFKNFLSAVLAKQGMRLQDAFDLWAASLVLRLLA